MTVGELVEFLAKLPNQNQELKASHGVTAEPARHYVAGAYLTGDNEPVLQLTWKVDREYHEPTLFDPLDLGDYGDTQQDYLQGGTPIDPFDL